MKLLQEEQGVLLRLRVAGQNQPSSINGRHPDVDHLNGREFVQHSGGCQTRCLKTKPVLQRDLQAVGQKRHQHRGVHAMFQLVVNRADPQFAFQRPEHRLNLRQLDVAGPQDGWIFTVGIGT